MSDATNERELMAGLLSKDTRFRLIVSGEVGVKEIETLIRHLKIDKETLAEDTVEIADAIAEDTVEIADAIAEDTVEIADAIAEDTVEIADAISALKEQP